LIPFNDLQVGHPSREMKGKLAPNCDVSTHHKKSMSFNELIVVNISKPTNFCEHVLYWNVFRSEGKF
jgi:hypothetical protein